jgi:hypothetical protein
VIGRVSGERTVQGRVADLRPRLLAPNRIVKKQQASRRARRGPRLGEPRTREFSRCFRVFRRPIHRGGYRHVEGLAKDTDGIWHGHAIYRGKAVAVALDDKGMVRSESFVVEFTIRALFDEDPS